MRNLLSVLFLLSLMFKNSCSQDSVFNITGNWEMSVIQNGEVVECPSFLTFHPNGNYQIFNDCYGSNPQDPIIEKGSWKFDSKEKSLIFTDRKFLSNYLFGDTSKTMLIHVKEVSGNEIQLSFYNNNTQLIEEIYKISHK